MGKHREERGGKTGSGKGGSQDPSPTRTAASCVILFCVSVAEEYFIPPLGILPKQFPSSS